MEIDINYKDIYFTLDMYQIFIILIIIFFFIYGLTNFILKIIKLISKKYKPQPRI